jgi:hypothetical protein
LQEIFQIDILRAWIRLSRYLLDHGPQLGWFPLWYEGIPLENSYAPLLPTPVAAFAWMVHISLALAHHQVSALSIALGR